MNKIADMLKGVTSIAIAGHIRPDGDCVGSCMGLYQYIENNYPDIKELDIYLEKIPLSFMFIQGTQQISNSCAKEKEYDLFIALDSGDTERLGDAVKYLKTADKSICIDHHISNQGYADVNYIVPQASSTSELIYELLDSDKITKEIAEALYMGIAHDTGVFQYSLTTSKTMRIAADLMETGIDFSKIVEETYFQKTYIQNQILGRSLLESILLLDGKCIVSRVRKKDMQFYGADYQDLEGIVSQLRNTKGVKVAIFMYESNLQEYKVSMRSDGIVDVSKIASFFGGGGHICASGCTMQGSFHDVLNNLTYGIEKQLLRENAK